jgi:hypothetical protein
VVAVEERRKSSRFIVEFLDADKAGVKQTVPRVRLRVPWQQVADYDKLMDCWRRLGEFTLTNIERDAVEEIFDEFVPERVTELLWKPVECTAAIYDPEGLQQLSGTSTGDIVESVASFDLDGVTLVSGQGAVLIAERVCRMHATAVLERVVRDEQECRELCKRGGSSQTGRVPRDTSPEFEYEWYRRHTRPRHELLRQWCGHRAVTAFERLGAAEAEVQRLAVIVARMIDELRERGNRVLADVIEREQEEERITPATFRPNAM